MSKYKYSSPIKNGYSKCNDKKLINKLGLKNKWNVKRDVYIRGDNIYYENFTHWYIKILETILFPIYILAYIMCSAWDVITEMIQNLHDLWFAKKTGSFTSGYINLKEVRKNELR